jgi:hypothetical protein
LWSWEKEAKDWYHQILAGYESDCDGVERLDEGVWLLFEPCQISLDVASIDNNQAEVWIARLVGDVAEITR